MKRRHRRQPLSAWRPLQFVVGDTYGATDVNWSNGGAILVVTLRGKRYTVRCRRPYITVECQLLMVEDL